MNFNVPLSWDKNVVALVEFINTCVQKLLAV